MSAATRASARSWAGPASNTEIPALAVTGTLVSRVREQHRELVAAQPGRQAGRAGVLAQRRGHAAQHGVASLVAEGVVHELEVVDVDDHHGPACAGRIAPAALELLLEAPAVDQAGEDV